MGATMKFFNDLIPRFRTSTDIDIRTRMIYSKRNGIFAGTLFAEEDKTPIITKESPHLNMTEKKIYA